VGSACVAALLSPRTANRAFSVSGGETLAYRDMVDRVFVAMGKRPRTVTIPLGCFRLAVALIRLLPRYRHWTASMAERMNADLMFDHTEAAEAFGFAPRGFVLTQADLP
jgi:nucleoside-diphosphate-sugar epimerase